MQIWEKAGRLLGVLPYAKGGIIGLPNGKNGENTPKISKIYDSEKNEDSHNKKDKIFDYREVIYNKDFDNREFSPASVSVNLGGINITVNTAGAGEGKNVIDVIRDNMPEISSQIAQEIAWGLKKAFANMKTGIN